jgi:hypothetical protein
MCLLGCLTLTAGCGGSDDDERQEGVGKSGSDASLTRGQIIMRGDAFCREYRERIKPIEASVEDSQDPQEIAEAFREVGAQAEKVAVEFKNLARRAPDPKVLDRYVRTAREQLVLIDRAADQFDAGDTEAAGVIIEAGQETGAELRGIAQGYGFKVCGSPMED